MTLTQLKYIVEIVRHDFNVSVTANALHTSQPGISAQVRLLEEELGCKIFNRYGKRITGLTEAGKEVYRLAEDT